MNTSGIFSSEALIENIPLGIVIFDSTHVLFTNTLFLKIIDASKKQVLSLPFSHILQDIFTAEDQAKLNAILKDRQSTSPTPQAIALQLKNHDKRWVKVSFNPLPLNGITATLATFLDITENKKTELNFNNDTAHLLETLEQQKAELHRQTQQLRHLSRQIVLAQEEERKRIARELHDESNQNLTVLKLTLEMLRTKFLRDESISQLNRQIYLPQIENAIQLCDVTTMQLRSLAYDLRPSALDDLGLDLTLEGLCQDISDKFGLEISYASTDIPSLSPSAEITLYRFLQEALTNAAQHAFACHVQVELFMEEGSIFLQVEDDGIGFDETAVLNTNNQPGGIGLLSIQERLKLLDGTLSLTTSPGQGTHITAQIPYYQNSDSLKKNQRSMLV